MSDLPRDEIEREIRRLAPWYYDFDLGGVRTSITAPCDGTGHRTITTPEPRPGYWRGRAVLDVACAEGAWSFGAAARGAAHVDAFDCRDVNIHKAEFVKRVWGVDRVDFHVATCDSWIEERGAQTYDTVMMCGILYHLTEPWRTIEQYCALARDSVLVGCVLWGGEDGYEVLREIDNIAASHLSVDSLMPRSMTTLIAEFAKQGFHPSQVGETGGQVARPGCGFLVENCRRYPGFAMEKPVRASEHHELYITPLVVEAAGDRRRPFDAQVLLYNRGATRSILETTVWLEDERGRSVEQLGVFDVDLPARPQPGDPSWTHSTQRRFELDLADVGAFATLRVRAVDAGSGEVVVENSARLPAGG